MASLDAVHVRLANSGDADRLARLNTFVHDFHVRARPDWFRETDHAELVAWFRALLVRPAARVWVAELGDTPVGYITSLVSNRPANALVQARRWCEIDNIVVHPEFRRRGVGYSLVETALASA